MRAPTHVRSGELGFNMTPMIDVVFLLIIFFLVSSHLARQEAQMELPLPTAESGEAGDETDAARRLTLNVLEDGGLLLAGRRVSPGELPGRLAAAREAAGGDVEVRIRGDRRVAYEHVAPVLLACARSGVWNVTIGVFRPEDAPR